MITSARRVALATLLSAIACALPTQVEAQGNGEDSPSRQFGAWLDDASAPVRGEGQMTIAVGHWKTAGANQTDAPMLGAGIGVSDRLQVSASVPFYRMSFEGASFAGVDSTYFGAKYSLIDPMLSLSEFGLSVGSVVEVLSPGAPEGRVHFVVPVSAELRRAPFRYYASAGYFSRGAFFSGGAVEWATPHRVILTGSITRSYSTQANPSLDALSVGRQRVDVSANATYPLGTQAAAFGSIGRSLSGVAQGGTRLALSGGISFWFRTPMPTP